MDKRYFVVVHAAGRGELRALARYDLDLFRQTAKEDKEGKCTIEGLMSLDEVGRLVKMGYQVTVKKDPDKSPVGRDQLADGDSIIKQIEKEVPHA
jgi:hypothetical protein